jgi:DNA processing protein
VYTTLVLDPDHSSYPSSLGVLEVLGKPLPTLYMRGTLPTSPPIAIVGCRAASREALAFTRSLVFDLADADVSIWSGGAIGIDGAAHKAALEAGIPTVVIMGPGLDCPYPPEHIQLYQQVLESGGALLSRFPDRFPPRRFTFLARNQVLAAITLTTVVVEAGLRSGARSTAAFAKRFGKPLCVVPHAPWNERGSGCAAELVDGARAITRAADVLRVLGLPGLAGRKKNAHATGISEQLAFSSEGRMTLRNRQNEPFRMERLGELEQSILKILGDEPMHIDVICERLEASYPAVMGALLTLVLEVLAVEEPAGCYRRR